MFQRFVQFIEISWTAINVYIRSITTMHVDLIFQTCGITLLLSGFYLFIDEPRVMLSRLLIIGNDKLDLPEPLFYYIAIGLTLAGVVALFASLIGWMTVCLNTYCLLSIVRKA